MECLYYTDGFISDRKTLTKLCLLFDRVNTFYLSPLYFLEPLEKRWQSERDTPFFSKSPCEKVLLTSEHLLAHNNFVVGNKELIASGVLNPIVVNQTPPDWEGFESSEKRLMRDGSGIAFGLWGQSVGIVSKEKIYVDAPWFSLYRWESIAGGLYLATQIKNIPISDNVTLSKLGIDTVRRFAPAEHLPTAEEIAANVAFQSISLMIPDIPALEPAEILELRQKLSDELTYFRIEMQKIASDIDERSYEKINSVVFQKVKPRLDDLELKIKSLRGELFRKIAKVFFIGGTATTLLSHFLSMSPPEQATTLSSFVGKILLDVHEYQSKCGELRKESSNRGLVFLIELKKPKS